MLVNNNIDRVLSIFWFLVRGVHLVCQWSQLSHVSIVIVILSRCKMCSEVHYNVTYTLTYWSLAKLDGLIYNLQDTDTNFGQR